jgi:hypothetical protein
VGFQLALGNLQNLNGHVGAVLCGSLNVSHGVQQGDYIKNISRHKISVSPFQVFSQTYRLYYK